MTAVRGRLLVTSVAAIAVGLIAPSLGSGSVFIARDARKPTLKIASNGAAEVGWTSKSGARESVVVPMRGRVMPGTKIDGKNVARKTSRWKLPFKPILRKGPKRFFYALQTWTPKPGAKPELRLSRWKGAPTQLTLEATLTGAKESVSGRVAFRKKAVFGSSPTPAGRSLKLFVLLDCFGCAKAGGKGWGRIAGRPLKRKDGSYTLKLLTANEGSRYRARLAGPNRGLHLAPDVQTVVETARPPAEEPASS